MGLKLSGTGDTLCSLKRPVALEPIQFPDPVISVAIEPKSSVDKQKLELGLKSLLREDPSCRVHEDPETGQTLLSGMGELHLEILVDRLRREFKALANVGIPQVSYREALKNSTSGQMRFERLAPGASEWAEVAVEISPLESGQGILWKFKNLSPDIPEEWKTAMKIGALEAIQIGPLTGFALLDVQVEIKNLIYDRLATTDGVCRIAAAQAVRKALEGASCDLLEPIFHLEILTPEEFVGNVVSHLNSRRGQILNLGIKNNRQIIKARAPLAELFGYATDLRSSSQGHASFSMSFDSYQILPPKLQQELLKKMGRIS